MATRGAKANTAHRRVVPFEHRPTSPDVAYELLCELNFLRAAIDASAIVLITDIRGNILSVNEPFCALSRYTADELLGQNHRILSSNLHDARFWMRVYRTVASGEVWRGEICNRNKAGALYWLDAAIVPQLGLRGNVVGYTSIAFDVTNRKSAEDRLWRLANLDELTGLPNRQRMKSIVDSAMAEARRSGKSLALALIDLDDFKVVNDAYGHEVGDELLLAAASALSAACGDGDLIARLGGDEFAILVSTENRLTPAECQLRFERLLEALRRPIRTAVGLLPNHASLGYALYPDNANDRVALWQNADIALYEAKANGRDQALPYDHEMSREIAKGAELLARIRIGLLDGEFRVYYQPILCLKTGKVTKLEALLRWQHPEEGLLPAGRFFDAFSNRGIAAAMGEFVLATVIKQIGSWRSQGFEAPTVAINSSAADLGSTRYVDGLLNAMLGSEVRVGDVAIEITEGILLSKRARHVQRELARLQGHGVEIMFDDFGTGYASLTHLRDAPIVAIKMSREFVMGIEDDARARALIGHVIGLAHGLGLGVVAEGVETSEQRVLLAKMGCDMIQGYLLSPAVAAEDVRLLIAGLESREHSAEVVKPLIRKAV